MDKDIKTTITKTSAGHYWVRVRSVAMPDMFDGDAYRDRLTAKLNAKRHAAAVRAMVTAEQARLTAQAERVPA